MRLAGDEKSMLENHPPNPGKNQISQHLGSSFGRTWRAQPESHQVDTTLGTIC